MTELELRQMFKNLSDCYADTWHSERGFMEEGEVIQAMTEDRFIEALKEAKLLPIPAVSKSLLTCTNCGDYYGVNINHQCFKCLKPLW